MKIKYLSSIIALIVLSCNNAMENTKPVVEKITESVYAAGIIKSLNQYQVYPVVSGIISKIFVAENDLVKTGTPLVQVSDQTSKMNRENASLAAEYADLNVNKEKLTDLENNILLAESKHRNDSLLLIRQQNLWNQNIGSRLELEQRELAYQSSKTAWESAKIKYNELLKQLKFSARQSNNNLAISRYKESDYIIKSDIDGKVYSLARERGEMVSPQTALAIIGDARCFLLDLQIDEYDIVRIKTGQKVLVSMDSYKWKTFEARISKIYPIMNERTKTFSAEAQFITQPPVLYPNLTIEANIIIHTKDSALTIPRNYLINDSLVLIAKNRKIAVQTGLKDYQKVEITGGLTSNTTIYKPGNE